MAAGVCWLVGAAGVRILLAVGVPGPAPERPVTILCGLCCLTVLGGVWSLGARLGPWAMVAGAVVLALSAVILWLVPERTSRGERFRLVEIILLGLVIAVVAAQTAGPYTVQDTAIYHLQAIRWIEQYPAVPGLANLFGRLAYSAPWFEAEALFDPVLFGGRPAFVLNGMVFVVAVSFFLGGLRERPALSRLLRLACVPAAFWLLRRGLSSAGPDAALALLSWIVMLLLAEPAERRDNTLDATAWVITALASFAVVMKPSAIPLLLAPGLLILRNLRTAPRRALALVGFSALIAAPFLVRNVIVSGYLVFPIPWTQVPGVPWAVPRETVSLYTHRIQDWAHLPNHSHVPALDFAAWVPSWLHNLSPVERLFVLSLPLLILISAALALRRGGLPRLWPPGYALLVAITLAGTSFWLLTAPDPRFGWGFFPFLVILLAVPLAGRWIDRVPGRVLVFLVALVLLDQGRRVAVQEKASLRSDWLWPVPPPAAETRLVAAGPFALRVPAQGEECRDAPLPCAPALDPTVVPRGATLAAGWTTSNTSATPSE